MCLGWFFLHPTVVWLSAWRRCAPSNVCTAMATRNLTMHFVRARSEALRRRPAVPLDRFGEAPTNAFGAGAPSAAGAYDTRQLARPPPLYVDTVDEINRIIDAIEKKSKLGTGLEGCASPGLPVPHFFFRAVSARR